MKPVIDNSTVCKRCGTCCKKGGPSFHIEDLSLIEEGNIPAKNLYTIRRGEPVYDNRIDKIIFAHSDIIKIKGQGNRWACFFYKEAENKCDIYQYRPLECRLLNCRDTREIEQIIAKGLLVRENIIGKIEGLWDMVREHDQRCSYKEITELIDRSGKQKSEYLWQNYSELIEYDNAIREIVVTKGGLESELLDFLFGRPVSLVISVMNEQFKYYSPLTLY
ncbi:MAG: YkgJ family cysteine cluster protein [Proteobacteria bacterium]|nr:YkgJ family cysteine cluster protein [Pseudomonadota bacterium]